MILTPPWNHDLNTSMEPNTPPWNLDLHAPPWNLDFDAPPWNLDFDAPPWNLDLNTPPWNPYHNTSMEPWHPFMKLLSNHPPCLFVNGQGERSSHALLTPPWASHIKCSFFLTISKTANQSTVLMSFSLPACSFKSPKPYTEVDLHRCQEWTCRRRWRREEKVKEEEEVTEEVKEEVGGEEKEE